MPIGGNCVCIHANILGDKFACSRKDIHCNTLYWLCGIIGKMNCNIDNDFHKALFKGKGYVKSENRMKRNYFLCLKKG